MAKKKTKRKAKTRPSTAKAAAKPADIVDPKLGTLRFICHINPTLDEYEGDVELDEGAISLRLYTDSNLDLAPTIKRTRELIRRNSAIQKRADNYIGANIFPEYNQMWREDRTKITKKEFLATVSVEEITVSADGKATYWYNVADLFHGHILQLFLDENTEFDDHDTPG